MSFHKLPNYLRTHRRRAGLSQDDVAVLLGGQSGAAVSRFEKFRRQPTLKTAMMLSAVYRVSVRELFAGQYEDAKRTVHRRAETMIVKLAVAPQTPRTARRLDALRKIALVTGLQ